MTFELARHIVSRITGRGKRDANILVTGQRGKGKSVRAGEIAEACAIELSLWKYGDELHAQEFFDPKIDLAVILEEKILEVLSRETDNHHIKVIDDVAYVKGTNSRKSLSNENDAVVSLFGINRTKQGILIIVSQDQDYLDIRLREQADYIIEQTGPMYDTYDVSFGTVSTITKHNKAKNKIRYPYLTAHADDGHTIRLGILAGGFPSKSYMDVYEPQREAAVDIINKRKLQAIVAERKERDNPTPLAPTAKDKAIELIREHPEWNNGQIAKQAGVKDVTAISRYRNEIGMPKKAFI